MSDPITEFTDNFLEFFRQHALAIYRFHLIRSGDWQDAEAMTAETFRRALAWFAHHLTPNGEAKTWLFRTAVSLYARWRRPASFSRADDLRVTPSQEQLSQFALVSDLHDQWRRLPRREQDARALYLFSGLELEEIAAVTGWKLAYTVERLGHLAVDQGEVRQVAGQIQPVGYFLGHLENSLRDQAGALENRRPSLSRARFGWLRYRAGPVLTLIGQVLPLLILGGMLFWVANYYTRQTSPAAAALEATPARPTREPTNRARLAVPRSDDSAILVSAQGGVFLYRLDTAQFARMIRISEDGFYASGTVNPDFLPQVSPDGAWLSMIRPSDGSTWLFSLNGTLRRQISASSLKLTWSPGGGEAVYPLPDDQSVLYQYSAAAIYNRELARFPGDIIAVAWSPDGSLIGVAYQTPGSSSDMQRVTLSVIPSRGGEHTVLASQEIHVPESSAPNPGGLLLWTDDSNELWYPNWNAAINVNQAIASEKVSAPPINQAFSVPLMPIIAQPFSDRYGVQTELLYGAMSQKAPWLMRNVSVSLDRRQIALLLPNPNGVVGTVAVQDSADIDQNRWIRSLGRVGKVSWTQEGGSLVASEYTDQPGQIYLINARNGRSTVIAEDHWLVGTLSEMRYDSGHHAPQAAKIPLTGPDLSGPTVRVQHIGLGISLEGPAHFRVWQNSVTDPNGIMMISNFEPGDPLGYVSLNADDLLVTVNRLAPPGTDMGKNLGEMARANPDEISLQRFSIGERQAYRLVVHGQDGQYYENIYIEDPNGPLILSYLPGNTGKKLVFDRMVANLELLPPPTPTPSPTPAPSPTPTPQPTPTTVTAWDNYTSPTMGVSFDLPAQYLNDPVCGVRETSKIIQVASEVYITADNLNGSGLDEYINHRLEGTQDVLHISNRLYGRVEAGLVVTLEGSLDMNGFFSWSFLRSNDRVYLIGLTPNQNCGDSLPAVSDLEVYRRLVASIRFVQ
ncbi:MAG TPA: hypothetical protein PJ988_08840 [Anaerolinea sp.]|nr:hypothetical protein [Anaerolinea sp.]